MMQHRKKNHIDQVQDCREYKKDNCDYTSERCWYINSENQVFQESPKNTAPPAKKRIPKV